MGWENRPDRKGIKTPFRRRLALLPSWENRPDRKGIKTKAARQLPHTKTVGKTDPIERGLRHKLTDIIVGFHVGKTDPIERGLRPVSGWRLHRDFPLGKQTR